MINLDFYFETSAYNFLANKLNINDAIATRAYQSLKGNRYFISPLTIWEVLLNGSDEKREQLVYFSQHLFFDKLLRTPSEIVIDYIYKILGRETRDDIFTKGSIGLAWNDISNDTRKTFGFEKEELVERSKLIQHMSKNLRTVTVDTFTLSLEDTYSNELLALRELINTHYNYLNMSKVAHLSKDRIVVLKLSIMFIYLLMYFEIDIDNSPVKQFWRTIKVDTDVGKINFLVELSHKLLWEGPFLYMATMAYSQMCQPGKVGRGLIFDALHTLYLPSIDYMLTNDIHFISFSSLIQQSNACKVKLIREAEFNYHSIDISK